MTLYDALKASKGLPVSDSYAELWGKSAAESGIKTLTGRLPIFFRTSESKLRDWVIYGNDDVGKNLVELTLSSGRYTNGGANLSYTIDKTAGTITLNGTSRTDGEYFVISYSYSATYGDYIISGGSEFASYRIWDATSNAYARKTDNSSVAESFGGDSTVRLPENHTFSHRIRVAPQVTFDNVVLHLMLRAADTSPEFEPYQLGVGEKTENGYVLNIGVGIAPISSADPTVTLITRKTINLGESPLTEGQTLSMSEFGDIETNVPSTDLFIAAFKGFHYDDQLSYNQPEMAIKGKIKEAE